MSKRRRSPAAVETYTPPTFAVGDAVVFRLTGGGRKPKKPKDEPVNEEASKLPRGHAIGRVKAVRDDGKLVLEYERDGATLEAVRAPLLCDPAPNVTETP